MCIVQNTKYSSYTEKLHSYTKKSKIVIGFNKMNKQIALCDRGEPQILGLKD